MSAYFIDSSALVKRYVDEMGSAWLRDWVKWEDDAVYIVLVTGAEVISAITRRMRRGDVSEAHAEKAIADFRFDYERGYLVADILFPTAIRAMDLAKTYGLRGYDAVQLATALGIHAYRRQENKEGVLVISADTELNAAAVAEGLAVENPSDHR